MKNFKPYLFFLLIFATAESALALAKGMTTSFLSWSSSTLRLISFSLLSSSSGCSTMMIWSSEIWEQQRH